MNALGCYRFPKPVCQVLVAIVLASIFGCGGSGLEETNLLSSVVNDYPASSEAEQTDARVAQQMLELRPLIDEAKEHLKQNELDEAVEKFTTVLQYQWSGDVDRSEISLLNGEVSYLRGQAFLAKGFPRIAVQDFNDAIKLGDVALESQAYFQRAKAQSKLTRWYRAVADCTQSIRLQPNNGQAFQLRARALTELRKWDQARASLLEAERLGIRTTFKVPIVEAGSNVAEQAKLFLDQGSLVVAREMLEGAVLGDNNTWETNVLLARTQFQLSEYDRAIVASTRALELNPRDAEAYQIRGLSYLRRGKPDQAIADFSAAIALDDSLREDLNLQLSEARRQGGIDPAVRAEAISRIQQWVAARHESESSQSPSVQWLLEIMEMPKSSDQINHLKNLLAETPEARFDSLNWLTDFLMLDDRFPGVEALRMHLDRQSPDVSPLEKRLWSAVESHGAAATQNVNMFPDLAAYAIEYNYYDVLQKCISWNLCRLKIDHLNQAVEQEDLRFLRLMLPNTVLLASQIEGLLQRCIQKNKQDHVRLIVNEYPRKLTHQIIKFLGMAEELDRTQITGGPASGR